MKMTKRDALTKCRDHWRWIASNVVRIMGEGERKPTVIKKEYFNSHGIYSNGMPLNACFCCEYAWPPQPGKPRDAPRDNGSCDNCPLMGEAWEGTCMDSCGRSTYTDWNMDVKRGHTHEAERHALLMVTSCDNALEDLKEGRQ